MLTNQKTIKQLVILSGKGGTGKTSLAASLIYLSAKSKHSGVYVDADVDAANLALIISAVPIERHLYWGSQSAEIDINHCNRCDLCYQVCRFNAIHKAFTINDTYKVIDFMCEGCAACVHVCPESAIRMIKQQDGEWFHSITPFGHLFHAELFPGADNSGKLVTTVKQHAKLFAEDNHLPLVIVDGPPGIGCPVISASAGADLALLVAEPGLSGLHDLKRIIQTLDHFHVPFLICINKADLYPKGTQAILQNAQLREYSIVGTIPFDDAVPASLVNGQPVTQFNPNSIASSAIVEIWEKLEEILFNKGEFL